MAKPFELRIGEHAPERADALEQGKTPVNYSRQGAVDYALFFCNRVSSDGVVMSGGHLNRRKPGALLTEIEGVDDENDCTHFVSCSLGTPPPFETGSGATLKGGGLHLSQDGFLDRGQSGVYGFLQPEPLVHWLKLTRKIAFAHVDDGGTLSFSNETRQFFGNTAKQVADLQALIQGRFTGDKGKGDLIVYYADADKDAHHSALLVNDAWGICCHTRSRCGSGSIDAVGHPLFIYARFKEFKEQEL